MYIPDLPDTISKKYSHANDLVILTTHWEWKKIESTISQDMSTLVLYLRQWRLKLSESTTSVSTVLHLNNEEAKRELDVYINTRRSNFQPTTTYLGDKLDRTLSYLHLAGFRDKIMARSICKLVGTGWGANPSTLHTTTLNSLVYAPAEYCAPTWSRSRNTSLLDVSLNCTLRIITGYLQPTPVEQLPVLTGIPPAELHRQTASLALHRNAMDSDHLLHHPHNHQGRDAT